MNYLINHKNILIKPEWLCTSQFKVNNINHYHHWVGLVAYDFLHLNRTVCLLLSHLPLKMQDYLLLLKTLMIWKGKQFNMYLCFFLIIFTKSWFFSRWVDCSQSKHIEIANAVKGHEQCWCHVFSIQIGSEWIFNQSKPILHVCNGRTYYKWYDHGNRYEFQSSVYHYRYKNIKILHSFVATLLLWILLTEIWHWT